MEKLTLNKISDLLNGNSIEQKIPVNHSSTNEESPAALILAMVDSIGLGLGIFVALMLRNYFTGNSSMDLYIPLLSMGLVVFLLLLYSRNMYPGFGIDAVSELRNYFYASSTVFTILIAISAYKSELTTTLAVSFLLIWTALQFVLPVSRRIITNKFSNRSWWGYRVMIVGSEMDSKSIVKFFAKNTQLGYKPVVIIDENQDNFAYVDGVPSVGGLNYIKPLAEKLKLTHAIFAPSRLKSMDKDTFVKNYSSIFTQILILPEMPGVTSIWVKLRDLGGVLGLELEQKLISSLNQFKKRVFDLILISVLSVFVIPLCLLIAIIIKFDSNGPVLFRQKRVGKDRKVFEILKFRTMHIDAEEKLVELLENDPNLRSEYEVYHKLIKDPRCTPIGRLLRKYSLDELPQFINVLKGEMSLIGPRAYLPWEINEMDGFDKLFLKVRPGITGLWQITNRNQSTIFERNALDVYYTRNWSMFLDLYITTRTVSVIVNGRNA